MFLYPSPPAVLNDERLSGFQATSIKNTRKGGWGALLKIKDVRRKPVIFSSFSDLYYKGRYAGRFGFKIKENWFECRK